MARPSIDQTRRKELIQATGKAIHSAGLADPTLASVCEYAGISSVSIVSHYFKSKQALFEATMHDLASGFLGEIALRVSSAQAPTEVIFAVIDANFAPSQCTPEAVSAWLWFWSRTPTCAAFAEIERATHHYIIRELERGLSSLLPAVEVRDAADSLMALMYGLWLRFALSPKVLDVEAARRITREYFLLRLSAAETVTGHD